MVAHFELIEPLADRQTPKRIDAGFFMSIRSSQVSGPGSDSTLETIQRSCELVGHRLSGFGTQFESLSSLM